MSWAAYLDAGLDTYMDQNSDQSGGTVQPSGGGSGFQYTSDRPETQTAAPGGGSEAAAGNTGWNMPAGANQMLLYGGLALGGLFVVAMIAGR